MTKSAKNKFALNLAGFILHILLNIIFYSIVVLLVIKLSTAAYEFAYEIYGDVSAAEEPGTDVKIEIRKGESTMDLAKRLKYNRLISNPYSFFVRAKLASNSVRPILAGTFILNTSMNYGEILDVLTDAGANLDKQEEPDKKEKQKE